MRFRKKRSKNVQLWTLVSPRIFIEKSWNFAQSCLNSSRIWGLFFSEEKLRKKMGKKIQKPVGGVFASQDWSQKNPLAKRNFFRKKHFLRKHPQVAKKWVFSLKNRNSQIFSQDFSNVDIWNIWTPIKWERKFQNPYW